MSRSFSFCPTSFNAAARLSLQNCFPAPSHQPQPAIFCLLQLVPRVDHPPDCLLVESGAKLFKSNGRACRLKGSHSQCYLVAPTPEGSIAARANHRRPNPYPTGIVPNHRDKKRLLPQLGTCWLLKHSSPGRGSPLVTFGHFKSLTEAP